MSFGRRFVAANTQYLALAQAIIAGTPLSMACWFRRSSGNIQTTCFCSLCAATTQNHFELGWSNAFVVYLESQAVSPDGTDQATAGAPDAETWAHAACVCASTTSRFAFLNGTKGSENPSLNRPVSMDRTEIGRISDKSVSTPGDYMDGDIAHVAYWNDVLTDQDVADLAAGANPLAIQPGNLIAYWPITGASPEIDLVSGLAMVVNGSPAVSSDWPTVDDPPVIQTVLPDGDLATGNWTTTPLYSKVNDADDGTYITGAAARP